jgi:hypothetical protein
VVDVAVKYPIAFSRDVETISLGEPVIERPGCGAISRRSRSVGRAELCGRCPVMDARQEPAQGKVDYRRQHGVAAREACSVHFDEVGDEIRTWAVDTELQDTAEHNPADDGPKREYGRAALGVDEQKSGDGDRHQSQHRCTAETGNVAENDLEPLWANGSERSVELRKASNIARSKARGSPCTIPMSLAKSSTPPATTRNETRIPASRLVKKRKRATIAANLIEAAVLPPSYASMAGQIAGRRIMLAGHRLASLLTDFATAEIVFQFLCFALRM